MQPEPVREVGRKFQILSDELRTVYWDILRAADSMDWSGAGRDAFMSEIRGWAVGIRSSVDRCIEEGRKVNAEEEEWETAAAAFGWGSEGYTPFLVGTGEATAVDLNDVDQGGLGTCYLMASLASLAQQHPELIEKMIRDNGDGTYTVTFHEKRCETAVGPCTYVDVPITVDMGFPTGPYDGYNFGEPGDTTAKNREIWSMLIERAYAKWKGGYDQINGGWPADALSALTGMDSSTYPASDVGINELYDSFQRGDAVTATSWTDPDITDTLPEYQNGTICQSHAYTITNVDPVNNTVTLVNPWNDDCQPIILKYEDYQRLFNATITNPIHE